MCVCVCSVEGVWMKMCRVVVCVLEIIPTFTVVMVVVMCGGFCLRLSAACFAIMTALMCGRVLRLAFLVGLLCLVASL